MMNRVVMVGRLTRDPELRRTQSGKAVANFTLALNRSFGSQDEQQADYIPCVVWNKTAEAVEQYCSKGSLVGVDGKLQSRSYDNAQGQRVYVVEVRCDSVQFLNTRNKDSESTSDNNYNSYQGNSGNSYQSPGMKTNELDINNTFANYNNDPRTGNSYADPFSSQQQDNSQWQLMENDIQF